MEKVKLLFKVVCPYCGNKFLLMHHTNNTFFMGGLGESISVYCDQEESPGCGKRFFVDVAIEAKAEAYYKLEKVK